MPGSGGDGVPLPSIPRYGEASLGDLLPSLLSALGMPGLRNPLGVEPVDGLCVMVIDGLGWELLRIHAEHAPFLSSLADARTSGAAGRAITA